MAFGNGSASFIGSQPNLQNEINRRAIAWAWSGTTPRGDVVFGSQEFIGSSFFELGATNASAANGSTVWSRDISGVGSKSVGTALEFVFDVRFKRF